MAKSYEHRVEVSFVVPVPEEEDPERVREAWKAHMADHHPEAEQVKVVTNWRGRVVRK